MKLYKVSQSVNNDYDTYSDFIVACKSLEDAKYTNPRGFYKWHDDQWFFQCADGTESAEGPDGDRSWCNPNDVEVEYIGEAIEGVVGVLCSSFHAG